MAHRGLHDLAQGRPENSRAAFRAAVENGYAIELDVQASLDHCAMVFHDRDLDRLTGATGLVRDATAAHLAGIPLIGGDEGIPTLDEVLDLVAGQVPVLIEVKDQDGALGDNVGPLEQAVCDVVRGYRGDVAVMSFNPHAVGVLAKGLPDVPCGLTTEIFPTAAWGITPERAAHLSAIRDYEKVGACFISHDHADLGNPRVAQLKAQGAVILCWTIRTAAQERAARQIADNITFEGYAPARA